MRRYQIKLLLFSLLSVSCGKNPQKNFTGVNVTKAFFETAEGEYNDSMGTLHSFTKSTKVWSRKSQLHYSLKYNKYQKGVLSVYSEGNAYLGTIDFYGNLNNNLSIDFQCLLQLDSTINKVLDITLPKKGVKLSYNTSYKVEGLGGPKYLALFTISSLSAISLPLLTTHFSNQQKIDVENKLDDFCANDPQGPINSDTYRSVKDYQDNSYYFDRLAFGIKEFNSESIVLSTPSNSGSNYNSKVLPQGKLQRAQ